MLALRGAEKHKGVMTDQSHARSLLAVFVLSSALSAFPAGNPFLGEWALTIPGGAAGWLGVQEKDSHLEASLMWGTGSVQPVASVQVQGDRLVVTRKREAERKDAEGKTTKVAFTEVIAGTLQGDTIKLACTKPREDGRGEETVAFSGQKQPPVPSAPDLSTIKFGQPVALFNGTDLAGWRLTDPNAVNGWGVQNGDLVNNATQEKGKHKSYGNLRTEREFEDFNLRLEVLVRKGENSGVYVRGIYEVQVADTYGKPLDSHNMGAVYSRITPVVAAEKPPGQWQTLDITFVDRHMTVVLNGTLIIDNQPVLGCTGGALWSDVLRPGPIYLQGDHTGIEYRNIVLRPVTR